MNWEKNPVVTTYRGQKRTQVFTQERLNTLATISRMNILLMSTLIIIIVYLIAKFYYADSLTAFFASMSLAVCFVFVYYSHTTCVDIPSMLWITLGAYFLLRSVYLNKLSSHLFMGLFFAFAACTKDAMLFYAFTFAIAYVGMRICHLHQQGTSLKKCPFLLFNKNTVLAIILFLFTFALLQNILISPKAYWERMGVWIGGRGVKDFNQGFKGQWPQLWTTLKMCYWAMGWPLVALLLVSLVYTMKKDHFFNVLIIILPIILFYTFISMRIKMTFIRYYLPVMGLLFLPAGAFLSNLFSINNSKFRYIIVPLISCIYVLSFLYCIALNLELINDSRNQTADWFQANVKKDTPVISLVNRPYGPKLAKHGYPMIENWNVPPLKLLLQNKQQLPDYLVLSTQWYTIRTDSARAFRQSLLDGQGGYSSVVQLKRKEFLIPQKNALSIACWPLKPNLGVSPVIIVMKKEN